jgi:putative tryptophan/tyrosine transport system substrate-binding protein
MRWSGRAQRLICWACGWRRYAKKLKEHAMRTSQKTPETITTIGIDLGKNTFHLVGLDNHPGGNITGMSSIVTDLEAKRLEILREIVPGIKRVAILGDFRNSAVVMQWDEVQTAARSLALEVEPFDVRNSEDINRAFETAVGDHVDAIRIGVDGTTRPNRRLIIELASKYKLPAVYSAREL